LRRWVGVSYFQFHTVSCFCPLNTPADSNTVHTFLPIQPYVRLFNFEFNYNYELFSSPKFIAIIHHLHSQFWVTQHAFYRFPLFLSFPCSLFFMNQNPIIICLFFFHHSTFQTHNSTLLYSPLTPFMCGTFSFFFLHWL